MSDGIAMEVESSSGSHTAPTTAPIEAPMTVSLTTMDKEEEEDISDLLALFRSTEDEEDDGDDNDGGSKKPNMSVSQKIEILGSILTEPSTRRSPS